MGKIIGLARLILGLSLTVWIMLIKPGHLENQAIPELTYAGTPEVMISRHTRSPSVATAYSQANEPVVVSSGSHRGPDIWHTTCKNRLMIFFTDRLHACAAAKWA